MPVPYLDLPLPEFTAIVAVAGGVLGTLLWRWAVALVPLPSDPDRSTTPRMWPVPIAGSLAGLSKPAWRRFAAGRLACEAGTAIVMCLLVWFLVAYQCQHTAMVTPSAGGRFWRIVFQLVLVVFLVAATVTDLRDYLIPDAIVVPGAIIGLVGQFASRGEIQIQHIWIDWNAEVPGLKGAWFPPWIDEYRHLHGLSVGIAGMLTGAGLIWFVRWISSKIIGQETMGLGDVTLMGMIGCYLGWQPVLFVFLIAPACAVAISLAQRFLGGKSYLPYGPFLSLATLIVLLFWAKLWTPLRFVFGHWPTLAGLIGGAAAAFVILLILARLYRMIPVHDDRRYSKGKTTPTNAEGGKEDYV